MSLILSREAKGVHPVLVRGGGRGGIPPVLVLPGGTGKDWWGGGRENLYPKAARSGLAL